ncbi:HalOD1 output domain-containing protein [Haloplanus salilacus]|uniref:HalOD1 output domain-containing protein n=1 Tax=Haloplanus salilacus TaxID=2949994 RepID=UPI0030CD56E0
MSDPDPGSSPDDGGDDVSVVRFDEENRRPSVVVAEVLETMLDDLNRTLFDYVDPDAMDELVGGPRPATSVTVSFEVDGTAVTVHGDGRVVVRWA